MVNDLMKTIISKPYLRCSGCIKVLFVLYLKAFDNYKTVRRQLSIYKLLSKLISVKTFFLLVSFKCSYKTFKSQYQGFYKNILTQILLISLI